MKQASKSPSTVKAPSKLRSPLRPPNLLSSDLDRLSQCHSSRAPPSAALAHFAPPDPQQAWRPQPAKGSGKLLGRMCCRRARRGILSYMYVQYWLMGRFLGFVVDDPWASRRGSEGINEDVVVGCLTRRIRKLTWLFNRYYSQSCPAHSASLDFTLVRSPSQLQSSTTHNNPPTHPIPHTNTPLPTQPANPLPPPPNSPSAPSRAPNPGSPAPPENTNTTRAGTPRRRRRTHRARCTVSLFRM